MKKRNYDTPVGLLVETDVFERIKFLAQQRKVSMSDIIRDGIKLKLIEIDKENIWEHICPRQVSIIEN